MPPIVAIVVGVASAFLFGGALGAVRRMWRRPRSTWTNLTPWYRTGPSVVLDDDRNDHPRS
jgi:hypothetical protein